MLYSGLSSRSSGLPLKFDQKDLYSTEQRFVASALLLVLFGMVFYYFVLMCMYVSVCAIDLLFFAMCFPVYKTLQVTL